MARDINEVRLIGRLGKDPELRYTPQGKAVATFSLATNRRVKRGEEWVDETTWHNIVVWDRDAEFVNEYLKKGQRCYVGGRIDNRSWEDANTGEKRYKSEVVASEVIPHDSRRTDEPAADDMDWTPPAREPNKPGKHAGQVPGRGGALPGDDSELPF